MEKSILFCVEEKTFRKDEKENISFVVFFFIFQMGGFWFTLVVVMSREIFSF